LDDGITLNLPDALYQGTGRQAEQDENRHENDPAAPFRLTAV